MSHPRKRDPIVRITVEAATADFNQLLERVENQGAHVTLTQDDIAIAALVPWSHYRKTREGLARLELAYWTAWTDEGTFNPDHLRQTVADLVEDRWPPQSSDESATAEPPAAEPDGA